MSPIQGVIAIGLGVVLGLLLYDAIKALYRQGRKITIDWESVGMYVTVTIAVVVIFLMVILATYGFTEMVLK